MRWNRRTMIGGSSAVLLIALGMVAVMTLRTPHRPTVWTAPVAVSTAQLVDPAFSRGGRALTHGHIESAYVVQPQRLPSWAKRRIGAVTSKALMQRSAFLWIVSPAQYKAWHGMSVSGLEAARVEVISANKGVPKSLLTLWAHQHQAYSRGPWHLKGRVWVASAPPKALHLSVSSGLTRALTTGLPDGGLALVVNKGGQILAEASNPSDQGLGWQPHPAGMAMVPPLLAEALDKPKVFSGLSEGQGTKLLAKVSSAWGGKDIVQGLKRLGLGTPPTMADQPVANPQLPTPATDVMTEGHALWVNAYEVAGAYLPFADDGLATPLTLGTTSRRTETSQSRSLVASSKSLVSVRDTLPKITAGGVAFRVWRPDGNYAIGISHGGDVVVIEGPATAHTVSILHEVGRWLSTH